MDGPDSSPSETETELLMEIWARARIRAFAHGFAARRLREHSQRRFSREVALTLSSLGLLIGGYFATQLQFIQGAQGQFVKEVVGNILFLSSIMTSLVATFVMLTSSRGEIIAIQSRHRLMVRSFLNIAQKVRRKESHVYDPLYYKYLISFLNDQIESLVTVGEDPNDDDYEHAHQRFQKVLKHRIPAVRHIFVPGSDKEEAMVASSDDPPLPADPDKPAGGRIAALCKLLGKPFQRWFVRQV